MSCIIMVHSASLQTCWQINISVKMILIKLIKALDTGMKYSLVETDDFTENFD